MDSAFGQITHTVVRIFGDVVAVCTESEYRRARKQCWEPLSVGFKLSDVLEAKPEAGAGHP